MPTILYTSNQLASKNLANALDALGISAIDTKASTVLDVPTDLKVLETLRAGERSSALLERQRTQFSGSSTDFDTDYILVLSSHKSKVPKPMLTMHFPGNWGKAEMGGNAETLNTAYAGKLKQLYLETKKANSAFGLNWEVTIEVDHHGPTAKNNVPIIFVEIGSSESEWGNPLAAKVLAHAIKETITNETQSSKLKTENRKPRAFFGVGGGHYAKEFCNFIEKDADLAVGHMLPKYAIDNATDSVLVQAITKSVEKVEKIIALKDSLNLKQKEKIRKFCENNALAYEEI